MFPLRFIKTPNLSSPGNTLHEQLKLAARAVSGLMEFKGKLDQKKLPVELGADGNEMDMSQVTFDYVCCCCIKEWSS